MTEQAKEQRRAYRREWYRANRDKVRTYQEKHWEKVAARKNDDFYAEDSSVVMAFKGKELEFSILECVEPGDGFEKGCLYASVGTNNGIQVIRENESRDAEIHIYRSAGFPAEAYDGSGKPSFRLVKEGRRA